MDGPSNNRCCSRNLRAFTLNELLVVIAIIMLLAGILMPALSQARKSGRLSLCQSNLKQTGIAVTAYGADFEQRFPSFSWTRHEGGSDDGEFSAPYTDDLEATSSQAVSILRVRAERTDIQAIGAWLPHLMYTHLVLNDYLQQRLPEPSVVCPEDVQRLSWQAAVRGLAPAEAAAAFLALPPSQRPNEATVNSTQRWPYSSSYQFVTAAYSMDQRRGSVLTVQSMLTDHYNYMINNGPLGRRNQDEIVFPSNKVLLYDAFARHVGKRVMWHAYPDTTQPLLFADNSVRVEKSGDANPGFYPNVPISDNPLRYSYVPRAWEPPTRSGAASELVTGYYAWCRAGLKGQDYNGEEVDSGNQ